mmetsp:Transcript_36884/g.106211  ORF Transcript_36884/g.106211 Transcript_36884/m.106211 type:complete len:190 (-) Transcript_36884:100-669(-)
MGPEASSWTMVSAGDPLRAYIGHGRQPPAEYAGALARDVDIAGHGTIAAGTGSGSEEVARLSSGLLLSDVHSRIRDAVAGRSKLRLLARSGHDLTITQLMVALGLPSHTWPAFGSSILIELLRERQTSRYLVRIAHFDGVPDAIEASVDVTVPLETWTQLVEPLILTEEAYWERCKLQPDQPAPGKMPW